MLQASLPAFHGALNLPSLPPMGSPVDWEPYLLAGRRWGVAVL